MIGKPSVHRHTWDQIPWIVNGTLPSGEQLAAEAHLQSCSDCREELEFQRRLSMSMERQDNEHADPQRSWQQLRARIEVEMADQPLAPREVQGERTQSLAFEGSPVSAAVQVPAREFSWTPWLAAAMVVQALGLGALGTAFWSRPASSPSAGTAVYRTLSDAGASVDGTTIRVVFTSDTSVARMQALLNEAGLQVRSGPSSAGVWSLEPVQKTARISTQSALQRLHGNPEVRFAEAVDGAP
jgi:hypothetical protein